MALAMPMASAIEKAGVWSDSDIARCESVLCQGHNSWAQGGVWSDSDMAAPKGGVLPQAIARRGAYCRRQ